MYQTGGTIKETIEQVQKHEYVLPAIQREFVWKPEQIQRLFDSLMQGYPFGTFLLWQVAKENANAYRFYDFVLNYHERDNPHCPQLPTQRSAVTAVLDGQQRLTALNIGLCGSMAIKLPHKWWNNPDAFPVRYLHLDLLGEAEISEEGDLYCFSFITEEQAEQANEKGQCWFKVGDILHMSGGPPMLKWLQGRVPHDKLTPAFEILDRLHTVIHTKPVVTYYLEKSQDLSAVLNIFIRLNSGGTVLSYSDLLLSIAVAQWKNLDARKEIHSLVDQINETGERFAFSQDMVLKAGLLLTDIGNVGFKVENFNKENMAILEENWPKVRKSLIWTVELVSSFGFSGQNLRAASAILPIAYYLHQRGVDASYITKGSTAKDRERIRSWLSRSILKASGIWGSGLDTLLTALRDTIREHGAKQFPVEELETTMAKRGKSLVFEDEEIEELINMQYGDRRIFALLSLLFEFVDLQNHFHIDHIFPRSLFTRKKLGQLGVAKDKVIDLIEMRDGIANLQLLEGSMNQSKLQKLPAEWLEEAYPSSTKRKHYCELHLLDSLPHEIKDFEEFYLGRRERLQEMTKKLLQKSGRAKKVKEQ